MAASPRSADRRPRTGVQFRLYRGRVLKSRDGIPLPTIPPPGTDMKAEARTARARLYPVTIGYTAYAAVVIARGLQSEARTAALFITAGIVSWTLLEYLVHRHVLHGRFPDGPGFVRHALHRAFDRSHGDHHLRPWDGRHINGGFDTVPFAVVLVATSFLARLPTWPVFMATILQCYVIEEWVHYAVHFHRFRWRYFEYIRRHHLYHHGARGRDVAFGLTSDVWDVALGTRIPSPRNVHPSAALVPRHHAHHAARRHRDHADAARVGPARTAAAAQGRDPSLPPRQNDEGVRPG